MQQMPGTAIYTGAMTEAQALAKLGRAARRLGLRPREVRARSVPGTPGGVRLSFVWQGRPVERTSVGQGDRRRNLAVLALWLTDVARNAERGIETPGEALVGERLPAPVGAGGSVGGEAGAVGFNACGARMSLAEARQTASSAAARIGIDPRTVRLEVGPDRTAVLSFSLPGGAVARKVSCLQPRSRLNAAALALWFRGRALHVERGIESVAQAFAALLPAPAGMVARDDLDWARWN